MKTCNKCKLDKNLSEFYKAKTNKNGSICYQSHCKSCNNNDSLNRIRNMSPEERKLHYKNNRIRLGKEYFKTYKLKNNYGISLQEYNSMYEKQNGKCYICDRVIEGRDVKVDHNHKTGKVRKLLCHNCNTSLGLLNEDENLFRKCELYLKEHNDIISKNSLA